jgi:hypothetical protein
MKPISNKYLVLLTFFGMINCLPVMLLSQTATGNSGSQIQLKDAGGRIIVTGESNMEVNTFLLKKFTSGKLQFQDGKSANDTALNFSILTQEVVFLEKGELFKVSKPVTSFSLEEQLPNGDSQTRKFENGFPNIDRNNVKTFYEILFSGKEWIILKYWSMQFRERTEYGGTTQRSYISLLDYYIFNQSKNSIQYMGDRINLKILKKAMPDYSQKLIQWQEKNPTTPKTDADFIKLFEELENMQ